MSYLVGSGQLQLDLRQRMPLPAVRIGLQTTPDLSAWSVTPLEAPELVEDHGAGTQTLQDRFSTPPQRWSLSLLLHYEPPGP